MSEMRSAQLREQRFPHLHCPGWVKLSGHVGADFQNDSILQIAVIVTDGDIEVIKEGPEITIHHPEEVRQQLVHDSSAACVGSPVITATEVYHAEGGCYCWLQVLAAMNEWCQEHHGASGLVQAVRDSTVTMAEAEQQVLPGMGMVGPTAASACGVVLNDV